MFGTIVGAIIVGLLILTFALGLLLIGVVLASGRLNDRDGW